MSRYTRQQMAPSIPSLDCTTMFGRYASSTLQRLLKTFSGRRVSSAAPDGLDFIEIATGFHEGHLPNTARPRSHHLYEHALKQYTELLKAINTSTPFIHIVSDLTGVYATIPAFRTAELYKSLKLDKSFPFNDLFARLAISFRLIRARPRPLFQYTFLDDLPVEILAMIISEMDEPTALIASHTCSGMRKLCADRLGSTAYFSMQYDMRVLHRPAPYIKDELALDIIRAMARARSRTTALIATYQLNAFGRRPLRFVSFKNEWDALWPPYLSKFLMLPENTDIEIFEQFYNSIISLLACRPTIVHLRLVSLSLTSRLIAHIQTSPNITRLTLERVPGRRMEAAHASKIPNITHLSIGFGGAPETHRNQWCLLTQFPNARHLFAYALDPSQTPVHYPNIFNTLRMIHDLETLHIEGSLSHITTLATWLKTAAARNQKPGSLQKLKVHSRYGIPCTDVLTLLDALSVAHPHLRILVLEGLDTVPVALVSAIRASLPALQGLSLVRRANRCQHEDKLCTWEEAVYEYADAMRGFETLRHLELNMMYSPTSPSPSALDALIAASYGYDPEHPFRDAVAVQDDNPHSFDTNVFADGASIAVPFAALCPALESFAIRAGTCFYSCEIIRHKTTFRFANVRSFAPHDRFESWNPASNTTW